MLLPLQKAGLQLVPGLTTPENTPENRNCVFWDLKILPFNGIADGLRHCSDEDWPGQYQVLEQVLTKCLWGQVQGKILIVLMAKTNPL